MSEPCWFMRIRYLTAILWFRYIPIKSAQYESTRHSWSKIGYFAWECWSSLRRGWSIWNVSKLNDPIHNMSYIVLKQKKIFCMIGLLWSQEGLCYRRDRNFFHSSNSLQLGGRPPPALKFNSYLDTDREVDNDKDVDMDNLIDMDIYVYRQGKNLD